MRYLLRCLVIFSACLWVQAAWAGVEVGQIPQTIELKENLGGRLDKSPWSSAELKGKVHVLFYVDPDEADLNDEISEALRGENFPREKFQSVAVINMGATWLPNFVISAKLKGKQERYPTTIYVRDYKKTLVKMWGLADDNSDVIALDNKGKLIFRKDGKLTEEEIETLIKLISDNLHK